MLYLITPSEKPGDTFIYLSSLLNDLTTYIDTKSNLEDNPPPPLITILYVGKQNDYDFCINALNLKCNNKINEISNFVQLKMVSFDEKIGRDIVNYYNTGLEYLAKNASDADKFMFADFCCHFNYDKLETLFEQSTLNDDKNIVFQVDKQKDDIIEGVLNRHTEIDKILHLSITQIMFLVREIKNLYTYVQYIDKNYKKAFIEKILFNDGEFVFCKEFNVLKFNSFDYDSMALPWTEYKCNLLNDKNYDPELTFVVIFKNEKDEVFNTIQSVFCHISKLQKFVVINDLSDDGYDYDKLTEFYPSITYIKHTEQKGIQYSRTEVLREYVTTPYYCLLDAHMRMYNPNVDEFIIDCSQHNPDTILCSNTLILSKNDNIKTVINESGSNVDVGICGTTIGKDGNSFGAHWYRSSFNVPMLEGKLHYTDAFIYNVPCILGACYFGTVNHFNKYLKDLDMLTIHGSDEQYLSMANWLFGFDTKLVRNFYVGHIYRDNKFLQSVHDNVGTYQIFNWIKVKYVFDEIDIQQVMKEEYDKYSPVVKKEMLKMYNNEKNKIEATKQFVKEHSTRTLDEFFEFNEEYTKCSQKFIVKGTKR